MRIFAGVAGAHGKHLKIKNYGKILKFTSQIKRSSPSGMGGGRCEASGEGLSHDRESRAKRRGGESEANGVIYVIPEFVFYFCTGNKTS